MHQKQGGKRLICCRFLLGLVVQLSEFDMQGSRGWNVRIFSFELGSLFDLDAWSCLCWCPWITENTVIWTDPAECFCGLGKIRHRFGKGQAVGGVLGLGLAVLLVRWGWRSWSSWCYDDKGRGCHYGGGNGGGYEWCYQLRYGGPLKMIQIFLFKFFDVFHSFLVCMRWLWCYLIMVDDGEVRSGIAEEGDSVRVMVGVVIIMFFQWLHWRRR